MKTAQTIIRNYLNEQGAKEIVFGSELEGTLTYKIHGDDFVAQWLEGSCSTGNIHFPKIGDAHSFFLVLDGVLYQVAIPALKYEIKQGCFETIYHTATPDSLHWLIPANVVKSLFVRVLNRVY